MAKVAALWSSCPFVPRPDRLVPGASEDGVIVGFRRESERGQGCRRSTVYMGGFTSLSEFIVLAGYSINKGSDDLTYFKHYPPCCPGTFGHVDSA